MLNGRSVTVVGAGIAGLTCAIALSQRGAKVRILERARGITEIGAGLQITPNGFAVLDALGLGEKLIKLAVVSQAVVLRDYRLGKEVVRLELARGSAGRPYLFLHRADLIHLLAATAIAAGVKIMFDCEVQNTSHDGDCISIITKKSGTEVADFVIGADGLHSAIRKALNEPEVPFFTGQVAWRAVVRGTGDKVATVFMGPGKHLVTYPLRGGAYTNIVAVEERDTWSEEGWHHPGDVSELRDVFSDFCPEVTALLQRVETTNVWGLFRHQVARLWYGQGIALIGDAAHPMLPFLAQGANCAIEDAWVLAKCLATQPRDQAMGAYQQRRRGRAIKIVNAANANARNYHLRNPLLRYAAHQGLRAVERAMPGKLAAKFDWVYDENVTNFEGQKSD